MVEQWLVANMS